ncbi:28S ribosomal protein S26, mitochondrial [Spea bombifrons]|uniref:28S ribosomal protein S26, mitochondrial n=1 Tax=Spea bombifrons TaxID=233779 RepID=UPI00234AE6A3|nr:28S ribosomal protein S26, mitochondrial [Spea bombifrons]XP_053305972.1 28S ribosomal protein S26, mitochondrial [Spea bombifrons]XP_053305980.1 28S ribosomal protein S26, mitochondrial [Spea bombifrons]
MLRYLRHSHLLRVQCNPCVTQSRGRKSRTDPPAKSKASRIKYPPPVCVEELLNVQHRYQEYTRILGAIRAEFKESLLRSQYEERVGSLAEQRHRLESEEHRELMAWNEEQNRIAQSRRLERLKQEERAVRLQQAVSAEEREIEQQEFIQKRQQEIEELQKISKLFITPGNLSERIEAALDNPKSYNFCVDREGRILKQSGGQA